MVHPLSHQIPRVRCYSGFCLPTRNFVYRTLTFFGLSSHTVLLSLIVDYAVLTPYGLLLTVWPLPISLAATLGISFWFLFLCLLRCFSSAGSPCIPILFSIQCYSIAVTRFRIRTSMDLCSFAAPHSFSQLVASFFGSWCLGILPTLLLAWPLCVVSPLNLSFKNESFVVLLANLIFIRSAGYSIFYLSLSLLLVIFALFSFQDTVPTIFCYCGGLKWTRTTDLTLIRRAL